MKLVGDKGTSLELSLEGYQFPDIGSGGWDANWLIVRGEVEHPRGSWVFRDPSLTTFEVKALASWFSGVASGEASSTLSFTEPNLEFRLLVGAEASVAVRLGYESAPPWLTRQEPRSQGITLVFPKARNDFQVAAQAVLDQLAMYPPRGILR